MAVLFITNRPDIIIPGGGDTLKSIGTLEQWHEMAAALQAGGFTIWQMQYAARQPEGFHVRFWASGRPEIEVVTHNEAIEAAIVNYRAK